MKNVGISVLILLLLLLNGCATLGEEEVAGDINYRRLAASASAHWGVEAISLPLHDVTTTRPITIAVIDTGAQQTENIESGYNVMDGSTDTQDESGHGTYVASILREVNPHVKIVPVKAMDLNGEQNPKTVAKGIKLAIQQRVDIINLSLGMPKVNEEISRAIRHADQLGIIVVAASGNNGDDQLDFPANHPSVLSVVARDINNVDAVFSNRSTYKKSFSAPGVQVGASTLTRETYVTGTSFATAYVSGAISLLLQMTTNSPQEVVNALKQTAIDGNSFSYGLIQIDQALNHLQNLPRNVLKPTNH